MAKAKKTTSANARHNCFLFQLQLYRELSQSRSPVNRTYSTKKSIFPRASCYCRHCRRLFLNLAFYRCLASLKVGSRETNASTAATARILDAESSHRSAPLLVGAGKDDRDDDNAGRRTRLSTYDAGISLGTELSRSVVANVVPSIASATTVTLVAPALTAPEAVAVTVTHSTDSAPLTPPGDPVGTTTEVSIARSQSSEKALEKGLEKGSEKGSDKGSVEGSVEGSEKGSHKGPEKGSIKGWEKGSEKGSIKASVDDVKTLPARVSAGEPIFVAEVEGARRFDHDDQGEAHDSAKPGASSAAPRSASPLSTPTAIASGRVISPTPAKNRSPDNVSVPSTVGRISTAASSVEVAAVPGTNTGSTLSMSIAATHLSARERLLRHVKAVTSSVSGDSDSSSCVSDTDNDDLGHQTTLQGENTNMTAHAVIGKEVADAVSGQEIDQSGAGAHDTADSTSSRPQTTCPKRRQREERNGNEHDEPGKVSKHDERVVSVATFVSPTNPIIEAVARAGATEGGDPTPSSGNASIAVEQAPDAAITREPKAADSASAIPAGAVSTHRNLKPDQQDAIITELAPGPVFNQGGVEETKRGDGVGHERHSVVGTASYDHVSAVNESRGGSPFLVVAAKTAAVGDLADREHDRNSARKAIGADVTTQDDGESNDGNLLDCSTTEPVRVDIGIGDSAEKTQGPPQNSERSLPVAATKPAQSESESDNRCVSEVPEAPVTPSLVKPTRESGAIRNQPVREDGDTTVVLENLKEETRKIDQAGEGKEGKEQGHSDGDDTKNRTDKPPDNTTELAWVEGYDPGHDCYYYHHVPTGESCWYRPDEPYEPYVHSDEEEEEEDGARSTLIEGGQKKDSQTTGHEEYRRDEGKHQRKIETRSSSSRKEQRRDEGKHQRESEHKLSPSRKSDRQGGSGDRRKKREQEKTESGVTTATGSSSRRGKSSAKRRSSRAGEVATKLTGSRRPGSSRKHAEDDDGSQSRSTPPSSPGSRYSAEEYRDDGGRGDRRRSEGNLPSVSSRSSAVADGASGRSRHRGRKTALERLNDFTDEDGGVSEGILSGGSGYERGRKDDWRQDRGHHNDRNGEDHHERRSSHKSRHAGGGGDSSRRARNAREGGGSPSRKRYHDRSERDRGTRDDDVHYLERHSSSRSRRRHDSKLLSPEDRRASGDDDFQYGRDNIDRRRSSDGRRSSGGRRSNQGSESRRSSTGTTGGRGSRKDATEWER